MRKYLKVSKRLQILCYNNVKGVVYITSLVLIIITVAMVITISNTHIQAYLYKRTQLEINEFLKEKL